MRNDTTLLKYGRLAAVYDPLLGRLTHARRVKNIGLLGLKGTEAVLLCGVGTGLDLPLLPIGARVVGVDLSPAMLERAKQRMAPPATLLRTMNAERLDLPSSFFDAAILSLVLSVAEDPGAVLRETLRVVRPGGRILIWDKFSPSEKPGRLCRALNVLTSFLGTDITRNFEKLSAGLELRILRDEPGWLGGYYRVILAEKTDTPPGL